MFVAVIVVDIDSVESFDSYSCFVEAGQMVKRLSLVVADWDS